MGSRPVFYLVSFLVPFLCLVAPGSSAGCPRDLCGSGPDMYYPHPDDCSKFCQCVHGNPAEMPCAPGTVFSDDRNVCVHRLSDDDECTMANAVRECQIGKVDLIPHPMSCERYFDCSDTSPREFSSPFENFEKECRHPKLFDIKRKKCVRHAECGEGRVKARSICRKDTTTWCIGKEDGAWPVPGNLWTPYFINCVDGKVENGEEPCPVDNFVGKIQLFHPIKRQCYPVWEVVKTLGGLRPSCCSKPPGLYSIKSLKKISYSCPGAVKFFCDPPLKRHEEDTSRCTPLEL